MDITPKRRDCLICEAPCWPVLSGLFDDRFGAPGTYDIMQCQHCGLEQTWPRPSEAELKLLYEEFYNWGGQEDTFYYKIREKFLNSDLYRLWLKWDGDPAFHLRPGRGRLLDVGCNEGRGLALYSRHGFQAEGVEINERAAAAARSKGFPVYTMSLAEFFPAEPFDVVVLANVLEHAADPVDMLTQVRRLLRPGGQVWISCPNAAGRWRRLFGRHWVNWHVPFHLWHFSPVTLKELLARADFRIVEMGTSTPSQWVAASFCTLVSRPGRANKWVRSAPIMAVMMLAARALFLPLWGNLDRRLEGDCLMLTATPNE